jgi:hypothetical protein
MTLFVVNTADHRGGGHQLVRAALAWHPAARRLDDDLHTGGTASSSSAAYCG